MRLLPALFLALALAMAGCASNDGDGDSTPTPTPDPTPEPTPDTNTTIPDDNETMPEPEPEPVMPVEVANKTHDYSDGSSAGQDGKTETFDVAAGYTTLVINITAMEATSGGNGLPGTGAISLNQKLIILDPDGGEIVSMVPAAGDSDSQEVSATVGTWTIKYEGTANVKVNIVGTAR